ncbi:hypothetical protein BDFB_014964, partial [Asbolus verrucosus]
MMYTLEQKTFLVELVPQWKKVDSIWICSVQNCMEEFRVEFPEVVVIYRQLQETASRCIKVFRETGSVTRKKGRGRPSK